MKIDLTDEQRAALEPHLGAGKVILATLTREQFQGNNPDTSGRVQIEFRVLPAAAVDSLRQGVRKVLAKAAEKEEQKRAQAATAGEV
jgi:hypothetical protein